MISSDLEKIDHTTNPPPLSVVVLRTLWRRRLSMARIFAGGVILSVVIVFLIPSYYESKVELMPPGWQSPGSNLAAPFTALSLATSGGGAAGLAGGLLNSRSPSGPLLGIIASRTMQDDLIRRFDLLHVYRKRYLIDARKVLARRTDASEDKPTGIISITVTDRDPRRARDMAAAYVEELNQLVVTMDTSAAHRERVFLEQRVKDVQAQIESTEQQLGHYSSRTGAMDAATQSRAMLDSLATVQGQLIAAQGTLRALESVYSDQSTQVKAAQARVATLQAESQKLEGIPTADSEAASDSDQAYPSLRQLPLLGVTYADLFRQTKTLEIAYELLSRELEAAKLEEAAEVPSVKVLDPPTVPQKSSFPPRVLFIVVGAFLSLTFGTVWILGREIWSRLNNADPVKAFAREVAASFRSTGSES